MSGALSKYQLESLDLLAQIKDQQDMIAIRNLISDYFAQKAENAIDALWEEGKITSETIDNWKKEHMRTHIEFLKQ